MRESWVRSMEARLVRDQLDICHRSEGVNSYENCRWLAEKYAGMIQTHKVRYCSNSLRVNLTANLDARLQVGRQACGHLKLQLLNHITLLLSSFAHSACPPAAFPFPIFTATHRRLSVYVRGFTVLLQVPRGIRQYIGQTF